MGTVKEKVFSFVLLGSSKIAAGPKLHSVFQINSLRWHFHLSKTSFSEIKCVTSCKDPGINKVFELEQEREAILKKESFSKSFSLWIS